MADMTITWKGKVVPADQFGGQSEMLGARHAVFDARATAAGFDVQPARGAGVQHALEGAVPYMSTDDDFNWEQEYRDSMTAFEVPKNKGGRPRKAR